MGTKSASQEEDILRLLNAGTTWEVIAKSLHCAKATISKVKKKHLPAGKPAEKISSTRGGGIPSWDELQRLALSRLISAEDKSFAPMLGLIMKYFPPPKTVESTSVPLAWDWAAPKQMQLRDAALLG
jgi:hypothetical protein